MLSAAFRKKGRFSFVTHFFALAGTMVSATAASGYSTQANAAGFLAPFIAPAVSYGSGGVAPATLSTFGKAVIGGAGLVASGAAMTVIAQDISSKREPAYSNGASVNQDYEPVTFGAPAGFGGWSQVVDPPPRPGYSSWTPQHQAALEARQAAERAARQNLAQQGTVVNGYEYFPAQTAVQPLQQQQQIAAQRRAAERAEFLRRNDALNRQAVLNYQSREQQRRAQHEAWKEQQAVQRMAQYQAQQRAYAAQQRVYAENQRRARGYAEQKRREQHYASQQRYQQPRYAQPVQPYQQPQYAYQQPAQTYGQQAAPTYGYRQPVFATAAPQYTRAAQPAPVYRAPAPVTVNTTAPAPAQPQYVNVGHIVFNGS